MIAKLADVTIETPAAEVSAVDRDREHAEFQSRYHELLVTDLNMTLDIASNIGKILGYHLVAQSAPIIVNMTSDVSGTESQFRSTSRVDMWS